MCCRQISPSRKIHQGEVGENTALANIRILPVLLRQCWCLLTLPCLPGQGDYELGTMEEEAAG